MVMDKSVKTKWNKKMLLKADVKAAKDLAQQIKDVKKQAKEVLKWLYLVQMH